LYGVFDHLRLLALATWLARCLLQLIERAGNIPAIPGLLGKVAVAVVLLDGANGVDQLALTHRANAPDSQGASQLLQLGKDHRVQA
jgi:hypothetical protein